MSDPPQSSRGGNGVNPVTGNRVDNPFFVQRRGDSTATQVRPVTPSNKQHKDNLSRRQSGSNDGNIQRQYPTKPSISVNQVNLNQDKQNNISSWTALRILLALLTLGLLYSLFQYGPLSYNTNTASKTFSFNFFTSEPASTVESIIDKQIKQVNEEISRLIENEFQKVSIHLNKTVGDGILDVQKQIKQLSTLANTKANHADLISLRGKVDQIVQKLPENQKEIETIRTHLQALQTSLKDTTTQLDVLKLEFSKHKHIPESLAKLTTQVLSLDTNIRKEMAEKLTESQVESKMQELQAQTSKSTQDMISDLRKDIEANSLTKETVESIVATMISQYHKENDQHIRDIIGREIIILKESFSHFVSADRLSEILETTVSRRLAEVYEQGAQQLKKEVSADLKSQFRSLVYEDGVGKADFALAAMGAKIITFSGRYSLNRILDIAIPFGNKPAPPSVILEPAKGVGKCWPFQGSTAFVVIQLSTTIYPESVTLDHIPSAITHNHNSVPRNFRVLGFTDAKQEILLGEFEYNRDGPGIQNFLVQPLARTFAINSVNVEFLSNYGHTYTCIYRFRVHGTPVA